MRAITFRFLNEREIRAAAGILFLAIYTSIMIIIFTGNFVPMKYNIIIFLVDFLIRVFISPKFSPSLIVGRLIVSRQNPEYVGAAQKKVAWTIGVALGLVMFALMVVVNSYSQITGIICLICLIFLFFESAFGICLGCLFYKWFKKEKAQYCPGEICDVQKRHDIQKTSGIQLLAIMGFLAIIFLAGFLFNNNFKEKPFDLLGIDKASQAGQKGIQN